MTATPSALDARYGRVRRGRRGRIRIVAAVVALGLLVLAWAVWTGVGGAVRSLEPSTVAVSVEDDRLTTVRWLVTGRADQELVCAVKARDISGVVVGLVEEPVPVTGRADRSGRTEVRTVRRAATGLIASCRDA